MVEVKHGAGGGWWGGQSGRSKLGAGVSAQTGHEGGVT